MKCLPTSELNNDESTTETNRQNYLLLVYIAINSCDWQDAITDKWHPQPTVFATHSALTINKCRWLRLIVNKVTVVLIVSADVCMQDFQGSNPTDVRRSTAFLAVELNSILVT